MTPEKFISQYDALLKKHGSQRQISVATGIPRSTMQGWLANKRAFIFSQKAPKPAIHIKASRRIVKRVIFTSAQDETEVHKPFLNHLQVYADYRDAQFIVGGFTYNKGLFTDHETKTALFVPEIGKFMVTQRMELGDRLMWCGEMNTLPTATSPLSGFEVYTREKWGIFPHAKVQLLSVPTMRAKPAKQIMTTGAVTLPNYIQKRAGIRAHFHHVLGAVIAEMDTEGRIFCRHLLGDKTNGSFQDLDCLVANGQVYTGQTVEGIGWGDIHFESIDPEVAQSTVALYRDDDSCMLDVLRPRFQFFHDVSDFKTRNHHNIKDAHHRLKMFYGNEDSIEQALQGVAHYLERTQRDWCQSVVVESNHDLALLRWLKEADWKTDPPNAKFYLEGNLECVEAIERGDTRFSPLEWAVRRFNPDLQKVQFLREDDSFLLCKEIECGMHGHLGANGSRGTPRQFTKAGPKANTSHTHCLTAGHKANVKGKGFIDLNEVDIGDFVSAYDPDHDSNIWTPVFDVVKGVHTGPLIQIGSALWRQTVTPQHKLFLRDGSYLPVPEAVTFRAQFEVPLAASVSMSDQTTEDTVADLFIKQIVAVAADGSVNRKANTIGFHVKKERKAQRISELFGDSLNRRPYMGNQGSYKAHISAASSVHHELMSVFENGKRLPEWFLTLNNRQARVFLDELKYWDGTFDTGHNGRQFGTSKSEEAMLVASVCNRLGLRVTAKEKCTRDHDYSITWCESDAYLIEKEVPNDKKRLSDWNIHTSRGINEPVFCLTTESQNFWVMHPVTGQVSLTGNSPSIIDGIYTGGTGSKLFLGYNKGLSSHAHAHVLTYPNAKRTIVTQQDGLWRA